MNRVDPVSPFGHKIRSRHRDRLAVVYIRQSTPQQVVSNRESRDLQYQLRHRAVALGWADDRVAMIDDDQGISGASVENRPGFQRLLAEVSLGHVGIVFGREMSRLARSCADWHHLLELCALFQVLLADANGVYDPADFNDRLLLGLKGTMSEAELHILRARLHQGKLNKARRGELFTCVPIGYVRSPEGGIALDPDEQVHRPSLALVGVVARPATPRRERPLDRVGERGRGGSAAAVAGVRNRGQGPTDTVGGSDRTGESTRPGQSDNAFVEWRAMMPRSSTRRFT